MQALEQNIIVIVAAIVFVERVFRMLLGDDELVKRHVAQFLIAARRDRKYFARLQMLAQFFRERFQIGVNGKTIAIKPAQDARMDRIHSLQNSHGVVPHG